MSEYDLERFLSAQRDGVFEQALDEIRQGQKTSHWMWFIFPQIKGLAQSEKSVYFGIQNIAEARCYISHPILGDRLLQCAKTLLSHQDIDEIFGYPDNLKLRSSLTLFEKVSEAEPIFGEILDLFFDGSRDERTLELIGIKDQ